jgi:F0F1-type ATP synthase membrane subunit b/b'
MPIEIRELVIKTEIAAAGRGSPDAGQRSRELEKLRREMLAECRRLINEAGARRKIHKR